MGEKALRDVLVNRERNDLRRCRNAPEDIGPSTLEIAHKKRRWFIYHIERRDHNAHDRQRNEQCHYS
jgi:hypothetical protein